jgi:hypothetical protein
VRIQSLDELAAADQRSLRFTPYGFGLDRALTPEGAVRHQQQLVANCDLVQEVPTATTCAFERIRGLHAYGVLFYDAYTVAHDQCGLALELALRERFLAWHQEHPRALKHKKSGRVVVLEATSWDQIDHCLRSKEYRAPWVIETSHGGMDFTGNVKTLMAWARGVGLLPGHRSRGMDSLLHDARIRAGHLSYHLLSPVESVRAIRDLAEIINQLWDHPTPGGRLFPGPLELEPIVISWSADALTATVATREQFNAWNPLPDEECVIVAGSRDDQELMSFDSWYERTDYPTVLLWGPGALEDARTWLEGRHIEPPTLSRLDRVFAVRYDETGVDLPMGAATAAALSGAAADDRWVLVRADHPDDAFRHAMHRSAGRRCVRLDEYSFEDDAVRCATDELYAGDHEGLRFTLEQDGATPRLQLGDLKLAPRVRVPSWR